MTGVSAQVRRASVVDVARLAGVGIGTVSNVLNRPEIVAPATRERVLAAIEELQFVRQCQTTWNLLFMDIFLITIPPLVMFIFFNRQIVTGMTAGAVKG